MPIKVSADLWELLPIVVSGLIISGFGLGMYLLGWAIGRNRGLAQAPEKYKEAYLNEQQKRLVAEGRLEAEQRASRRVDAALNALTAQPQAAIERQSLRAVRP